MVQSSCDLVPQDHYELQISELNNMQPLNLSNKSEQAKPISKTFQTLDHQ